jgi:phage-related protein
MPSIGGRCHELRIHDQDVTWRIVYYMDDDAVVILKVFKKKTQATPTRVTEVCKARLRAYKKARERRGRE